jgi:hypothetical protein
MFKGVPVERVLGRLIGSGRKEELHCHMFGNSLRPKLWIVYCVVVGASRANYLFFFLFDERKIAILTTHERGN